jgi:hypothetical protein
MERVAEGSQGYRRYTIEGHLDDAMRPASRHRCAKAYALEELNLERPRS